jgi:hypothetical protein
MALCLCCIVWGRVVCLPHYSSGIYTQALPHAVQLGYLTEAEVDVSLKRVLTMRHRCATVQLT